MRRQHAVKDVDISGKITSDTGEPLPGASVLVKGTSIGTTTNADGEFTLRVPDDGVLVVSFIGFVVYEEAVGNKIRFDIQLTADATQLQDVVVVGYGTAHRPKYWALFQRLG